MSRIVLHTLSQAHTFDLAKELHKTGDLARIISGYPRKRLLALGLSGDEIDSFPLPFLAWMVAIKLNKSLRFNLATESWPKIALDRYGATHLPDCDLFIGTSSISLATGRKARARGAFWLCDRPCSHIELQDELIREEYALNGKPWPGISRKIIERELAEYVESDAILVASSFTGRSFTDRGIPKEKLWKVPYGIDLSRYAPAPREKREGFDVLYAGLVSVRKGVSYLLEAFKKVNRRDKRLHIVGDAFEEGKKILAPYAGDESVVIHGHVPQNELVRLFSNSDVLVLPSIEDGYGLVVPQALACRCPVIVSENAGAADTVDPGVNGFTFRPRDIEALTDHLQVIADDSALQARMADAALESAKSIGDWSAFARGIVERFELTRSAPATSHRL